MAKSKFGAEDFIPNINLQALESKLKQSYV